MDGKKESLLFTAATLYRYSAVLESWKVPGIEQSSARPRVLGYGYDRLPWYSSTGIDIDTVLSILYGEYGTGTVSIAIDIDKQNGGRTIPNIDSRLL